MKTMIVEPLLKPPVYITHVKMMHHAVSEKYYHLYDKTKEMNENPHINFIGHTTAIELKDKVDSSQYQVAKIVVAHSDKIVVHEGLDFICTYEKFIEMLPDVSVEINENFKDGIPETFEQLTAKQRDLLREHNGAFVMLALHKIDAIYPSMDAADNIRISEEIQAARIGGNLREDLKKIADKEESLREKQAIDGCVNAAKLTGNNKVLNIYGGAHDFSKYAAQDDRIILTIPINAMVGIEEQVKESLIVSYKDKLDFIKEDWTRPSSDDTRSRLISSGGDYSFFKENPCITASEATHSQNRSTSLVFMESMNLRDCRHFLKGQGDWLLRLDPKNSKLIRLEHMNNDKIETIFCYFDKQQGWKVNGSGEKESTKNAEKITSALLTADKLLSLVSTEELSNFDTHKLKYRDNDVQQNAEPNDLKPEF